MEKYLSKVASVSTDFPKWKKEIENFNASKVSFGNIGEFLAEKNDDVSKKIMQEGDTFESVDQMEAINFYSQSLRFAVSSHLIHKKIERKIYNF